MRVCVRALCVVKRGFKYMRVCYVWRYECVCVCCVCVVCVL